MQRSDYGGRGSAAYDLSRFQDPPGGRKNKPELVVKRPTKQSAARARARANLVAALKMMALILSALAVVAFILYSLARLTELNAQINQEQIALNRQITENTRLQTELEAKMSMRNIEEYATQKLGMTPMDKSQVTYVDLSDGQDKIEITADSPKKTLVDEIMLIFVDVKEYIDEKSNID